MTQMNEIAIAEIDEILASILSVDGITGAMVFDPEGALLGAQMPAVYTDDMLTEVADQVVSTVLTLKEMKFRIDDLTYSFDGLRLVLRDLRKKGWLCLLSQPTIGTSLLNITTNVAQKKLAQVLDGKAPAATRSLRAPRPSRPAAAPTASGGPAPTAPAAPATAVPATSTATALTGTSLTGSSGPALVFEPEPGMNPELIIYNVLLLQLLAATRKTDDSSVAPFLEALMELKGKAKLNGSVGEEIQQWCRMEGAYKMRHAPSRQDMAKLVHGLYVFLIEYHGPVMGDRLLKGAVRATDAIPAAREFSAKSLL